MSDQVWVCPNCNHPHLDYPQRVFPKIYVECDGNHNRSPWLPGGIDSGLARVCRHWPPLIIASDSCGDHDGHGHLPAEFLGPDVPDTER